MRALQSDEKSSTVFVYTASMLARGDVILRGNVRVSIWLRTQGVPNFIQLYNAQMLQLAGLPPKSYAKSEAFIPTQQVLGFHLAPPASDPVDYDASEANRKMEPVHVLMGSFELKGNPLFPNAICFWNACSV